MNVTPTFIRTRSIRTGRGPGIGQYGPRLDPPGHDERIRDLMKLHGPHCEEGTGANPATPLVVLVLRLLAQRGPLQWCEILRALGRNHSSNSRKLAACEWFERESGSYHARWRLTEAGRKALEEQP